MSEHESAGRAGGRLISWNVRFTVVAALLAGTAFFLQARPQFTPPRIPLVSFPAELKSWVGKDIPIPDQALQMLGPGEFFQRRYTDQSIATPYVDLYLARLPNYHGWNHHLPENCLVGSGWSRLESDTISLTFRGDTAFRANRYLIARKSDRQLVLFWYSTGGRRIARENWTDLHRVFDSLHQNPNDKTLMIRMNTPLLPGENPKEAEERLHLFAGLANPILNSFGSR